MIQKLAHVCIPVRDYEEAIDWYKDNLGFEVRADEIFGPGYRWITMAPQKQSGIEIILYQIRDEEKDGRRMETGNIFGWVFESADCKKTMHELKEKGVHIVKEPEETPWGVQGTFQDLYGNSFVLLQPPAFHEIETDMPDESAKEAKE